MRCQLCNSSLIKQELKVGMRTPTSTYDYVCRRCVTSSRNRTELYKLEQARRDFESARASYHESVYKNDNWVPYYDELLLVNLYSDVPDYIFKD